MSPRALFLCTSSLALLALAGCDFGTLDDLATDEAAEAPSELSVAARGFWSSYDADEAAVKKLTADIEGIIARTGTIPIQAKVADLQRDDLKLIGFDKDRDPSLVAGMLIVTELDCTLDEAEKLAMASNQPELYPNTYDAYKRTYKSSAPDYLARKADRVAWETDLTATVTSKQYRSILSGGNRRFATAAPGGGPMFLSRTFLTTPATFLKGGEDSAFKQDYQIELYYERPTKKTVHFYAVWREFNIGSLNSDSNFYQSLVLGNLVDFDKRTSKICRDKAPAPKFD
ncbi:MAG: hypothetical protein JNL38_23180 [Myxococcales bacterium]|jgi:hypothetical protein|nr:hypothetical protein [Myxococcales bacterium]